MLAKLSEHLYEVGMIRTIFWTLIATVLIVWGGFSSDALALDAQMFGFRGGISDNRNDEDFEQYEGFATWNLPGHGI